MTKYTKLPDGDYSNANSVEAQRLGRELAARMKANPQGFNDSPIREAVMYLVQPGARNAFLIEAGNAFGGLLVYPWVNRSKKPGFGPDPADMVLYEAVSGSQVPSAMARVRWNEYVSPRPIFTTILVPLSSYQVKDGETRTYSLTIFNESSTARGNENYVDVYVTMEGGINVKVISIKSGVKVGIKAYEKREDKKAARIGVTISKSFVIQRISQPCQMFSHRVVPAHPAFNTGYLIQRKEVGDILGPFWPRYNIDGSEYNSDLPFKDEGAARDKAESVLQTLLDEAAVEISKRLPPR